MTFKFESGRSMVEILGVLAIVGVLSVGGIAGYSYGMDKYRANEVVNEVNLRSVDLFRQAHQGVELSLAGWETTLVSNVKIQEFGWTEDNYIYMDLSDISQGVCERVYQSFIDQEYIVQVDINAVRSETTDLCGDDNMMTIYLDPKTSNVNCIGEICFDDRDEVLFGATCRVDADCGQCMYCTSSGRCSYKYEYDSDNEIPCEEDGKSGFCYYGRCTFNDCTQHSQCEADEYCGQKNNEWGPNDACFSSRRKGCQKMDLMRRVVNINGEEQEFFVSRKGHFFNDARSMCERIGKEMVTIADLIVNPEDFDEDINPQTQSFELTPLGLEIGKIVSNMLWTGNTSPYGNGCQAWTISSSPNKKEVLFFNHGKGNVYMFVCR